MASAHAHHHEQHSASQQQQRFVSSEQHEEAVREMEQIRHTNATLDVGGSDSFRAQTEQAAIRIVTPHYKIPDKPGTDVRLGQSAADLTHKFAEANGADYKAERSQEHFRMQIIDPKVVSNALVPGHAIRDYARRHLIDDFPSLHGKRSFLDLDAMEQLRLRRQGNLGAATDRDKDLEKYLKNRDGRRWDLPPPPKVEDESLREFDRLRQNIDHLQKARSIPRVERSVVRVEPPAPLPQRKQIVEVRREIIKVPAAVKHTVHRIEEKKRTEEVERRVVRRERRHKSRRLHRSHHSSSAAAAGGHQQEYHYGSWAGGGGGGGGGYRSSSASRRSGYTNGFGGHHGGGEHHLMPIAYEGSRSAASDRYFGGGAGRQMNGGGGQHARYGSVSDSLRRGDLKYGPNGELLVNGSGNVKHHRVHKAHSTRDVFYHGDGGRGGDGADSHYSSFQRRGGGAEPPFVEFPPTLDRRSDWSGGGPEPPPHHGRQFADEYAGSGGVHQLTKARSFADWEEGGGRGRAQFGSRHDEDMARLEHEFRDARLMRIPSGNMQEKEHHHREIPGGYETYSRETKAHSDRKVDGVPVAATGQPTGTEVNVPVGTVGGVTPLYRSREASQDFGSRRDGQK